MDENTVKNVVAEEMRWAPELPPSPFEGMPQVRFEFYDELQTSPTMTMTFGGHSIHVFHGDNGYGVQWDDAFSDNAPEGLRDADKIEAYARASFARALAIYVRGCRLAFRAFEGAMETAALPPHNGDHDDH